MLQAKVYKKSIVIFHLICYTSVNTKNAFLVNSDVQNNTGAPEKIKFSQVKKWINKNNT